VITIGGHADDNPIRIRNTVTHPLATVARPVCRLHRFTTTVVILVVVQHHNDRVHAGHTFKVFIAPLVERFLSTVRYWWSTNLQLLAHGMMGDSKVVNPGFVVGIIPGKPFTIPLKVNTCTGKPVVHCKICQSIDGVLLQCSGVVQHNLQVVVVTSDRVVLLRGIKLYVCHVRRAIGVFVSWIAIINKQVKHTARVQPMIFGLQYADDAAIAIFLVSVLCWWSRIEPCLYTSRPSLRPRNRHIVAAGIVRVTRDTSSFYLVRVPVAGIHSRVIVCNRVRSQSGNRKIVR
jgi:hypothetical protein